jgi:hypothetical protein
MSPVPLARLQRWMQAVTVHPGSIEQALESPEAQAQIRARALGDVIRPSRSLGPADRVAVYHGMYLLRMCDALAGDYDALEHFLGEERFRDLVRDYVQAHPSRSFTLNRLGDRLPEFVAAYQGLPRRGFCHDLARLQLAVTQVFDAEETTPLSEERIAAVPPEAWEHAVLEPVAAFRLLAFRYPVNAYLQSVKEDDHDHPKARRQDTWVALYRRNYAVYRQDLERDAHALLADLVAGTPLGLAITKRLAQRGRCPTEGQLFAWFRHWTRNGVFQKVEY